MFSDMYIYISVDIMLADKFRRKRMLLIILDIIGEGDIHGYGIGEKIERLYGIKKPGSGIIYPVLSILARNGMVKIVKHGERDKKVYRITDKGKRFLEDNADDLREAKRMLRNLGEFYRIGGKELMETIYEFARSIDTINRETRERIGEYLREVTRKIKLEMEKGEK